MFRLVSAVHAGARKSSKAELLNLVRCFGAGTDVADRAKVNQQHEFMFSFVSCMIKVDHLATAVVFIFKPPEKLHSRI